MGTSSDGRLVLVAEDFLDAREMYSEYLRHEGFRVVEAGDGETAVSLACACIPAVVVMDLSLPVMNGWDATLALRKDPRTRSIPILALTAHVLEGERERALRAGFDAFLAKPCAPRELVAQVRSLLEAAPRSSGTRAKVDKPRSERPPVAKKSR